MRAGRARSGLSAVFLDRDGVINRKAPEGEYVTSWAEFEFLPGALEGLRILTGAVAKIVVATNQRGVALGRMTATAVVDIHRLMRAEVEASGGRIDAIYYCPHDIGCDCRKPEIGMFERAADELELHLADSAVVGDSESDMVAAERIGAVRVLIAASQSASADYVAADLADAARWLVSPSR